MIFEDIVVLSVDRAANISTSKKHNAHFRPRTSNGLVLYTSGSCLYNYPNRDLKFVAKQGDFIFLPQGEEYEIYPPEDSTCILINFKSTEQPKCGPIHRSISAYQRLHDIFSSSPSLKQSGATGSRHELFSIVYRILSIIESEEEKDYIPKSYYIKLEPAMKEIENSLSSPDLSVSQLAKLSGMSEKYFSNLFLSCYGETPKKYIINRRIELSKAMLSSTGNSISDISEIAGFSSVYYFSRLFRKVTGRTPSEYRAKNLTEAKEK